MNENKSPGSRADQRKKMTKEQIQMAMVKKKECEERALKIVYQLIEPKVDCIWLLENLKHINRCHLEDVIEERAITKVCGYILCQKPLTAVINQTYHISLKDKKVYDMTKRKNFCSSSCFGASNYLLEQMLTSPLWMREKEDIPEFLIFSKTMQNKLKSSQGEVDVTITQPTSENEEESEEKENSSTKTSSDLNHKTNKIQSNESLRQELSKEIDNFVFGTIKYMNNKKEEPKENIEIPESNKTQPDNECKEKNITFLEKLDDKMKTLNETKKLCKSGNGIKKEILNDCKSDSNVSNQHDSSQCKLVEKQENFEKNSDSISSQNVMNDCSISEKKILETMPRCETNIENNVTKSRIEEQKSSISSKNDKPRKVKLCEKSKLKEQKSAGVNLTAKIEQSFKEWVSEETIQFLFGTDSFKKKAIEDVEHQDKYEVLCAKLNRLQFQEEQDDAKILEKPILKPLPHLAVLQEEGKKLEIKVRAFYEGKTTYEDKPNLETEQEKASEGDTFLPLMESHAPQALRRKIFLEKLDKILPELLKTLSGNNYEFRNIYLNYTSYKSLIVKTLIQTFTLSPKNIIFKSVEWTLVGLVMIKMLSIVDSTLNNLLNTKQANMFVSMILTSYQLDVNYLNIFVNSFNPNINLR